MVAILSREEELTAVEVIYGWVITFHKKHTMWLFTHALSLVKPSL